MGSEFRFSGVIPANLLPFNDDFSIDEASYRRHLSWLADVDGVSAIVCNGHAAEVSSLTGQLQTMALTPSNEKHVADLLDTIFVIERGGIQT